MLERHGANHGAYRSVLVGGRKSSGDKVIWRHSDRKALWRLGFRDVRESPGTSGTTALFPWHARGQGFKSPQLHQPKSLVVTGDFACCGVRPGGPESVESPRKVRGRSRSRRPEGARSLSIVARGGARARRSAGYNPNMRSAKLLDEIEREAIDGDIVKALRLCLSLGGKAGSAELRDWASRELSGYRGEDIPDYRRIYAPLQIDGMTFNAIVKGQTISTLQLPDFARDGLSEEVPLRRSLPGLVDLVTEAKKRGEPIRLGPPEAAALVTYMNSQNDEYTHIERLYWSISASSVQELIDRVRSNLVELVAEMRAGMSSGETIPSAEVASQAVNVVVYGDKARISVKKSNVQASEGPIEKSRLRRWLEVAAWLAGIGGLALLLVLNWNNLFG